MLLENNKSCLKTSVLIYVEVHHKSNQAFKEKNQYLLISTTYMSHESQNYSALCGDVPVFLMSKQGLEDLEHSSSAVGLGFESRPVFFPCYSQLFLSSIEDQCLHARQLHGKGDP